MPRSRLPGNKLLEHILTYNAPFRSEDEDWFDKSEDWASFVNMSISEISTNLFRASLRWHSSSDIFWVIMSFASILLGEEGVYFSTTNNIYPLTRRMKGAAGLEALFAPRVDRKVGWFALRKSRPNHLTTCEQAEVLYPHSVPMTLLRKVYVRNGDDHDWAFSVLQTYNRPDVEVVISDKKFYGVPN